MIKYIIFFVFYANIVFASIGEVTQSSGSSTIKRDAEKFNGQVGLDLQMQMNEQMITPELLTNRFCGNLGLANSEFIRVCSSAIQKFREIKTTPKRWKVSLSALD